MLHSKCYLARFNGNVTFCITEWKILPPTSWIWFCKNSLSLKLSAIISSVKNLIGYYKCYQTTQDSLLDIAMKCNMIPVKKTVFLCAQSLGEGFLRLDGRTSEIDFKFEILFVLSQTWWKHILAVMTCLHLLPLSTPEH